MMRIRPLAILLTVLLALAPGGVFAQTATTPAPATTAAAPAPAAATAPAAPAAAAPLSGEQYVVRLRDLEQRINELKEEIFRSKARLSILAESVLNDVVGGARLIVVHENRMGDTFRLTRATYALDGGPIRTLTDEALADQREFAVYNGQIGAGEHTLTISLEYQGNGYGIFSYVRGYSFRVRNTHAFSVPEGKAVQIRVIGFEQGGPTTPAEERPQIRYVPREMTLEEAAQMDTGSAAAAQPAAGAATTQPAASTSTGTTP